MTHGRSPLMADQLRRPKVAKFLQCAKLDLPDSLACYMQAGTNLFERSGISVVQPKAHLQDVALAARQLVKHLVDLLAADQVQRRLGRGGCRAGLDEVRQ